MECEEECGSFFPSFAGSAYNCGPRMKVKKYTDTCNQGLSNFCAPRPSFTMQEPVCDNLNQVDDQNVSIGDHMDPYAMRQGPNPTDDEEATEQKGSAQNWNTKRVGVSKTFSFKEAASDPSITVFTVDPNIFKKRAMVDGRKTDDRRGNLKSCLIHHARVVQYSNNFPTNMAASISGVPGNCYTSGGRRVALLMLRNGGTSLSQDYKVHIPLKILSVYEVMQYAGITKENIMNGIEELDENHYAIPPDHIMAYIMDQYQSYLKVDPEQCKNPEPGVDPKYWKIAVNKNWFGYLSEFTDRVAIDELPYKDFNQFQIAFHRADVGESDGWLSTKEEMKMHSRKNGQQQDFMENQFNVSMELEIAYMITSNE